MIAIFPEFLALADAFAGSAVVAADPDGMDGAIFGDELLAIPAAASRQRTDFIAGRTCARQALRQLGAVAGIIGRTESGAPLWPSGWVGSIAHCAGCVVAVSGSADRWQGFGIDVEPAAPLPADAADLSLTLIERRRLEALPEGYARWSRAMFCAKECVHKLLNPLTGAWLEFDEIAIELDPDALGFQPRPLSAEARHACDGLPLSGQLAFSRGFLVALLAADR